jgi:hypothetical protein
VPAGGTLLVPATTPGDGGWYDVAVTNNADPSSARRFAGKVETNAALPALASSENPCGFRDNILLTASIAGFGSPTGSMLFKNKGSPLGGSIALTNGLAVITTAALPRGTNVITAEYTGDPLNPPLTNSLLQVVTNHPPVVAPATYLRLAGLPLSIAITNLLAGAEDADGDALTLATVSPVSARGVPLTTNGTRLVYGNSTNSAPDQFSYTVTDGFGGSAAGLVTVLLAPRGSSEEITAVSPVAGMATISYPVVTNYTFVVRRATNLAPPVTWFSLGTNTPATNTVLQTRDNFSDLPTLPNAAYYQLLIQY